jgi:hypothetical protein
MDWEWIIFVIICYLSYLLGKRRGYVTGYNEAKDEDDDEVPIEDDI